MRNAIEHISDMVKAEMPDYIMSSEELNTLAADCWFNVVLSRTSPEKNPTHDAVKTTPKPTPPSKRYPL